MVKTVLYSHLGTHVLSSAVHGAMETHVVCQGEIKPKEGHKEKHKTGQTMLQSVNEKTRQRNMDERTVGGRQMERERERERDKERERERERAGLLSIEAGLCKDAVRLQS